MERRTFIKSLGIAGAGLLALPSWAQAPGRKNIGLQLYTLRDVIGKNIVQIIKDVAETGYKDLETFDFSYKTGFFGLSARDFSSLVKDNGLSVPSNHLGVDLLFKDGSLSEIERFIEVSATMGSTYITIPYIDWKYRKTLDDYKKIAETFNKAAALCNASGMRLAYHNHEFEFKKFGDTTGLDTLISETDAKLMDFELDIYWVARSNVDPLTFMRKYKGRFPLWHVKDMSKLNIDHNTEIGNGSIDYPAIFKEAKKLGLKHAFVEQETNYKPNPMGSAISSYKYLKGVI